MQELFEIAKNNQFALPAVNVTGTNTVNGVLEAAKAVNSPVIIQFSNGGGVFYAGKTLANANQEAAIAGSISGAYHVHQLAKVIWCSSYFTYRSLRKKITALVRWLIGCR